MASAVVNLTLLAGLHGVFSPLLLALGAVLLAFYAVLAPMNLSLPPEPFNRLRPSAPRSPLPSHS
jgi:hypothetical protein